MSLRHCSAKSQRESSSAARIGQHVVMLDAER